MNEPQRKNEYTCPGCSSLARRVEELEAEQRALMDSVALGSGDDPEWQGREQRALQWLHEGVNKDGPRGLAATLFAMLTEWTESYNHVVQKCVEREERVGELEEDRDALLALGRAARRYQEAKRRAGDDKLTYQEWEGGVLGAEDALHDALDALPARLRERLEEDHG